jgi:hypothetical protein
MSCQVCHIRHLDDDGAAAPTQDIPEAFYDMVSTGAQTSHLMNKYFKSNPVDPTNDLPELVGKPFRYYPGIRYYNGKLTTVKPLYTAWFGEWLSGEGDSAVIRPYQLRLIRKAMTGSYAPGGAPRLATLPPVTLASNGVPVLWKKAELQASLLALRNAEDTANPDTSNRDIAIKPVLVMADKVYYLNESDQVEYFHSIVAESHDFAINHNTVAKRDPLNPVVNPGPYGAGGCTDCHGPNSAFFYGKQLAAPAEYEFLDEHGTVPNPNAGKPAYSNHYEHMGYSALRAGELTGTLVPTTLVVSGANGSVSFIDAEGATVECDQNSGACTAGIAPGGKVTFTAVPATGTAVTWQGCTPGIDPKTCTVTVGTPTNGFDNYGTSVLANFVSANVYTINASASAGGSITPSGETTVVFDSRQTYSFTPDPGYRIGSVIVDGTNIGTPTGHTFYHVSANHTLNVNFVQDTLAITSTAGTGGSINPLGVTNVPRGGSQTYNITVNPGYRIYAVKVNGASKGAITSYTFDNVQTTQKISVTFAKQ